MMRTPWLIRNALRTFRWLLFLYPRAFRAQFGRELAQVFTAQCHEGWAHAGPLGLAQIWWRAAGDLVITALAERWSSIGGMSMSRQTQIQRGGMSLMAAGIMSGMYVIFLRSLNYNVLGGQDDILSAIWYSCVSAIFVLGAVGLHALLAGAANGWRWVSTVAIIAGLTLFTFGNVFATINLGETATSCGFHCTAITSSGNFDHAYALLEGIGLLSIFIGVVILGILMQQRQPLAWWGNLMPLTIAALLVVAVFMHPYEMAGFTILVAAWTAAVVTLGWALWRAGLAMDVMGEVQGVEAGGSQ